MMRELEQIEHAILIESDGKKYLQTDTGRWLMTSGAIADASRNTSLIPGQVFDARVSKSGYAVEVWQSHPMKLHNISLEIQNGKKIDFSVEHKPWPSHDGCNFNLMDVDIDASCEGKLLISWGLEEFVKEVGVALSGEALSV